MTHHDDYHDDTPHLENTFMDFVASESYVSPGEKAWLAWAEAVEKLLGYDLDGNQDTDGFSIDFAYATFEAGVSAAAYAAEVRSRRDALYAIKAEATRKAGRLPMAFDGEPYDDSPMPEGV